MTPRLSILIPVFNESENVREAHAELSRVLGGDAFAHWRPCEIVIVDDGSSDDTLARLRDVARQDRTVVVVALTRNFGQTGALACALSHSSADVVVIMDGDLQNDPGDIPRLLERIGAGSPIVCGWRTDRRDWRRFPTGLANWIVRKASGVPLHDCAFPLKALRREYFEGLSFTGEMHRYLGIYAALWGNVPVVEVPVRHRFRRAGRSKYGLDRLYKIVPDLVLIRLLTKFASRPMHLFGGFGMALLLLAATGLLTSAVLIVARDVSLTRLLPAVCGLGLAVAACFAFAFGFVADLLLRTRALHVLGRGTRDAWPLFVVRELWRDGRCVDSAAGSDLRTGTF